MSSKDSSYTNQTFVPDDFTSDKKSSYNVNTTFHKTNTLSEDERKHRKFSIMKNVLLISLAFVFLFQSFQTIATLQSSLNKINGTTSNATIYVAMIIACFFVPTLIIKKLKPKITMALSMLGYGTFIMAQYHPIMGLLIPSSILVGVAAGPLWAAKCTYLTKAGTEYASLNGEKKEAVITRFFGIFFMFFQSTQIWGSLISSLVLSSGIEESTNITKEALSICGANFCPSDLTAANSTNENLNRPSDTKIYTIVSIFLVSGLIAPAIIALFVDPLSKSNESDDESESSKSGLKQLFATFQNVRHPYQLLIIPLTIFSGLEQGFLQSDFTAAYITCGLGPHMIGFIFICYGICDAVFSLCFSPIVNKIGRLPVFTLAALINLGICITFLKWMPHPDDIVVFFVIAALWGIADAVWQTQINALYGVIFPGTSEAAYSNYRVWESAGFAIAYFSSGALCISTKVTILFVFLAMGMLGYYIIEVIEKKGGLKKDEEGNTIPIDKRLLESMKN